MPKGKPDMVITTQGITFSRFKVRTVVLMALMLAAALLAYFATPRLKDDAPVVDMERSTPTTVGPWKMVSSPIVQVGLTTTANDINQPYDQTVMRTYEDGQGHAIQLALAWGRHQRQEVKIHRPELCYPAQGLAVKSLTDVQFPLTTPENQPIVGKRMVTVNSAGQIELVSYWIRIGSTYSSNAWETRLNIMKEGLAGRVTDGVLVRVSQRVSQDQNYQQAFTRQEHFIADLYRASPPDLRGVMVR